MKKGFLLLVLFAGVISVWAQTADTKAGKKGPFRFNNRMIEYAAFAEMGIANNLMTMKDIFQDTLVVDLTSLDDEFKLNMDAFVSPFTLSFNWKDRWGFSIFVSAEMSGNMGLSRNILNFSLTDNEKVGFGSAVFAEAGGSAFFHVRKFKIKVKPAAFVPLFYTKPDISYTYLSETNGTNSTTNIDLIYDMRVYTAMSMEDGKTSGLTAIPGVDLGAGVEYPLFPFLDLGVDFTHIPLIPATLKDYMEINGKINLKINDDLNFDNIFSTDTSDMVYGTGSFYVLRPFKMLTWADYRPFNTRLFSVIGSLGFSISQLYEKPGAVEAGLKIRSDVANVVIVTLGSAYEDRLWKNGIDLALNARVIEFDLGVDMRSQSFTKSWAAGGVGVKFGLKMGW